MLPNHLATPEENPEVLANCLRVSRHEALAQGDFDEDPNEEEAPEEAPPEDQADLGTISSEARMEQSESGPPTEMLAA